MSSIHEPSNARFVRPRGRGKSRPLAERTTPEQRTRIRSWFWGRLPDEWFASPATIEVDDDEILVVGELPPVALPRDVTDEESEVASLARISGFREDSRVRRMGIADEATALYERHVSWGARCAGATVLFTTASVPVMTRLRLSERTVLDTLIDAGVARSRSEALAWCVRLVGRHEEAWISDLRRAFEHVEAVRNRGPRGTTVDPEVADS
jgi:hypothetical protein